MTGGSDRQGRWSDRPPPAASGQGERREGDAAPGEGAPGTLGLALLIAALLTVGALGWWLQLRPSLEPDARSLSTLPYAIAGFRGRDIPLESTVEAELRADANVQRAYVHPATGDLVWLYLGYYGTARGGRPEHTPRGCYTGAGWAITEARVVPGGAGPVNEYLVQKDGERRLVHFWYRSWRTPAMTGGIDQNLDRMAGRLLAGRADGALIRVSTPITSSAEAARSRLAAFERELAALVGERWPVEHPAGERREAGLREPPAPRARASGGGAPPGSG